MADDKKLKLLVFSSASCSACDFMKKRKVVKLFGQDNENVEIEEISTDTEEGDTLADEYDIKALPAFVFEDAGLARAWGEKEGRDEGAELLRQEGAVTLQQLGVLHQRALVKGAGRKARGGK